MTFWNLSLFYHWAHQNFVVLCLLVALGYLLIVRLLRYQRIRSMLAETPYQTRKDFSSMTLEHAFRIQKTLAELEFPFTFHKALQFALFRTYGIPSVSKLLIQTRQLSSPATASKRYVDTVVLIVEFCQNAPQSDRALAALARMNYMHSIYRKAGTITNDDLLYTLSLFTLEPMRWIDNYEWRQLEPVEKCALATFWKATGDAMGITYDCLDGSWEDGLEWLDAIESWAKGYERDHMKPHTGNHQTAEQTTKLLLWYAPSWAKGFGKKLVCTLMDERLRIAMMYEKPSEIYYKLTFATLAFRQRVLRHLALPRPQIWASNTATRKPNSKGHIYMNTMDAVPFYVKPTLWNRYGPFSWLARAIGVPVPENGKFGSDGFKTEDVGPDNLRGKGHDFAVRSKASIAQMSSRGCPFI